MNPWPGRAGILGVILAGGLARRMGGRDKGLLALAGRPVIAHVLARALPQVGRLIVNANGDPARFAQILGSGAIPTEPDLASGDGADRPSVPIVADALPGFPGPLAGLHAGMLWVQSHAPDITHVATMATDTPFLPSDLVARLAAALAATPDARIAIAASDGRPQPVFALVPIGLAERLEADIRSGKARRVLDWLRSEPHVAVDFAATEGVDPFFNINTPDELAMAEALAAARPPLTR